MAFLLALIVTVAQYDESPHVHVVRRGVLVYEGVRYPPITCENNSTSEAVIIYRGERFTCPKYSTTTWDE